MSSGPTSLGGLYVTVNLDVNKALQDFDRFTARLRTSMRSTAAATSGGATRGTTAGLTAATQATRQLTSATDGAARSVRRLSSTIGTVRGPTNSAAKSMGLFARELGNAAGILAPGRVGTAVYGMGALTRSISALAGGGLSAGAVAGLGAITAGILALTAAAVAGTVALTQFTKIGIDSASSLERLTISMETLLGGPGPAAAEIAWLQELAKVSPFLTETIINMDKLLLAANVADGELRGGLIKATTDFGAALGLTDENLASVVYAFSQVQNRGYLSGDELRQLANQFIPVWEALGASTQFVGLFREEMRKLAEEGGISAESFFVAMIEFSAQFSGAAERMSTTWQGLMDRIKDSLRIGIGTAFLNVDASPFNVLKDVLEGISIILKDMDFTPLTEALGELMAVFVGPVTDFMASAGEGIRNFFEQVLPRIIKVVAIIFTAFRDAWSGITVVFDQVVDGVKSGGSAIVNIVVIAFGGAIAGIQAFIGALQVLIAFIKVVVAAIRVLFAVFSGNLDAVKKAGDDMISATQEGVSGIGDILAAPLKGLNDAMGVIDEINKIKVTRGAPAIAGAIQDVAEGLQSGGGVDKKGGSNAAKTVDELRRVMDELFDLTQRWFGMRSALEQGLLGDEGFEASIDQIASMGQKLVTALEKVGAPEVARLIAQSTLALIELARNRELVAERLKAAEDTLADAIKARDQMAKDLRDSTFAFANSLKLETETVTRYRAFSSGGVGFFAADQQEQTESFADALKRRLQALREFLDNIRALGARGLDRGLLEQLLMAGPEQAGEIAAGLAEGGQAMVDEVNGLQGQIGSVADALAEFGAETFHNAGVEQAQALVDGLNAEMATIVSTAEAITQVVYDAVTPWAAKMEEEAKKAVAAGAAGLASGLPAINSAVTSSLVDPIKKATTGWGADFKTGGEAALFEFDLQTSEWLTELNTWANDALAQLNTFVILANGLLEGLKFSPSGLFDVSHIKYGLFSGIASILENMNPVLKGILSAIPGIGALFGGGVEIALRAAAGPKPPGYGLPGGSGGASGHPGGHRPPPTIPLPTSQGTATEAFSPEVRVFIGSQELRDIVDQEVVGQNTLAANRIVAGHRT